MRTLVSSAIEPLAAALGFETTGARYEQAVARLTFVAPGAVLPVVVAGWDAPLDPLWRMAAREGLLHATSWCLLSAGGRLRVVDIRRAHARCHVEFDLPLALDHERASMVLWALLRADAFQMRGEPTGELLGAIVRASEEEGVRVCSGLRTGVVIGIEQMLTALVSEADRRRRHVDVAELHEEALVAVYRMLFLLFAEARMLLPSWHPVYRRAYSLEALRRRLERGTPLPGIWEAVQAIGRLAHGGAGRAIWSSRRSTAGCSHRRGRRGSMARAWATTA
jgi:hypothetical protein